MFKRGIIIVLSKYDYYLAKACFSSIKEQMPEIPIALLIDGDFKVDKYLEDNVVKVIRKNNVNDDVLRTRSFGWGLTKMIAFWESPFEQTILIDADTIFIKDSQKYFNQLDGLDLIMDLPRYSYSDVAVKNYFFDKDLIAPFYKDFNIINDTFSNVGILIFNQNVLDKKEYFRFLDIYAMNNKTFPCPEQGWLNLMAFNLRALNGFKFKQSELQILVPDVKNDELHSVLNKNESSFILHFAGNPKPQIWNTDDYASILNKYRVLFLLSKGYSKHRALQSLYLEDFFNLIYIIYPNKIKKLLINLRAKLSTIKHKIFNL